MSKTTRKPTTNVIEAESTPRPIAETSQQVLRAAFGAVALTQEGANAWLNRCLERGAIAEGDVRQFAKQLNVQGRKLTQRGLKFTQRNADKSLAAVLDQLDIPSKADIEALSRKITTLTHKVEALQ